MISIEDGESFLCIKAALSSALRGTISNSCEPPHLSSDNHIVTLHTLTRHDVAAAAKSVPLRGDVVRVLIPTSSKLNVTRLFQFFISTAFQS